MIIDFTDAMLDPEIVIAVSCLKLNAVKLFPTDIKKQNAHFAKNMLMFLKENSISNRIDQQELIDFIIDANLPNNYKSIQKSGYAAGSLLIHMLAMDELGEEVSVNKAKFIFRNWNMNEDKDSLRQYKTKNSIRSLTQAWSDFKSVAHIWASNILVIEGDIEFVSHDISLSSPLHNSIKNLFEEDNRYYIAHIKSLEKQYLKLNLGADFWQLPSFYVGITCHTESTQWNAFNQSAIKGYTYVRGE